MGRDVTENAAKSSLDSRSCFIGKSLKNTVDFAGGRFSY